MLAFFVAEILLSDLNHPVSKRSRTPFHRGAGLHRGAGILQRRNCATAIRASKRTGKAASFFLRF